MRRRVDALEVSHAALEPPWYVLTLSDEFTKRAALTRAECAFGELEGASVALEGAALLLDTIAR